MKKVLINLYIDKEQKEWLIKEAKKTKISIAQLIRNMIDRLVSWDKAAL